MNLNSMFPQDSKPLPEGIVSDLSYKAGYGVGRVVGKGMAGYKAGKEKNLAQQPKTTITPPPTTGQATTAQSQAFADKRKAAAQRAQSELSQFSKLPGTTNPSFADKRKAAATAAQASMTPVPAKAPGALVPGSPEYFAAKRAAAATAAQADMGRGREIKEAGYRNYDDNRTGFGKNSQAYRADGGANDEDHESDQQRAQQEQSGTWYIRLNGKLIKDKQGNPYSFRGKAAANKAALTMQAKLFNKDKEFMLTTNPNDKSQGVTEDFEDMPDELMDPAVWKTATLKQKYKAVVDAGLIEKPYQSSYIGWMNDEINRITGKPYDDSGIPRELKNGELDLNKVYRSALAKYQDRKHSSDLTSQDREHELTIGSSGRAEMIRKANELAEMKRVTLRNERLQDEEVAFQRAETIQQRKDEMKKIADKYQHDLTVIDKEHRNNMESIRTGNDHEIKKIDKDHAEARREREHSSGESDKDRAEREREREQNRPKPEKPKPDTEPEEEPRPRPSPGAGNKFDQDTGEPIRPQSNQWHTNQQLSAPTKPSKPNKNDDDVTDVELKPIRPLALGNSVKEAGTGVPFRGVGGASAPQKTLMAVSLDKWKEAVLNRYPEARFMTQKMINGATIASNRTGQVGIYDPKNSYAKVGPETQQGVAEGGQVYGQPQWQMPNAPSPTYTPGKPLPQSLQQKLDGKPNTGRAVDAKGRTQQQWVKLVKAKFPDAKIMQSKMIDGPSFAMLSDGRKLSWNKVEQVVAEKIDSRYRKTEWIPIPDALEILKHYGATIEEWGGHFHFAYYDREGVRKRIEDLTWNADDTRNVRLSILNQAVRELKAQQQGVAEGSQRVDSLVTDALKIMRGSDVNDAVQALKTVLGNREYNDRRGHYNFYVRQLMDMYGQQGVAEDNLIEFALPGGNDGDSGSWYTDDELADIIGDDWFEDFDVSHDEFNIDTHGEKAKQNLASYANSWFDDKGYNVNVMGVDHNDVDHDLKWYIVGSFHNPNFADKDVDEAANAAQQAAIAIAMKKADKKPKSEGMAPIIAESKAPTNLKLWESAQQAAKKKFNKYPTTTTESWATMWYNNQGGAWTKG